MNVKKYSPEDITPVRITEVFRYAGGGNGEDQRSLYESCLSELLPKLSYQIAWSEYPVRIVSDLCDLGFTKTLSKNLAVNLCGCKNIVLFAATVGLSPDRLSMKYSRTSPARALIIEAIATERIEALCDAFCKQFENASPRFSPGFGDLSIDLQREILDVLDCRRKIGLTLNDSMLIVPTKSVTGIIGIK